MVADIEKYPEFLPWCRAARILERKDGELLAELVISFKHLTESYVSRVVLSPPGHIDVAMVRGPFEHLVNKWSFTPQENGQTRIDFLLDFKFRSKILEKLMGALFSRATDHMAQVFKERADALYGNKP